MTLGNDLLPVLSDPMVAEATGFLAAGVVFLTFCMKTMLALRVTAIAGNLAFIAYASLAGLTPILVLHGALLPLNVVRLVQMNREVRAVRATRGDAQGGGGFGWLAGRGRWLRLAPGETLFVRGDVGDSMFVVVQGGLRLPEIGVVLGPGELVGEMSLFSPDRARTATAVAEGPAVVAEITEREMRRLYFDNPEFAYELIRLVTRRMLENQRRAEETRAAGLRAV